ncbi:hypothetical protein ANACOL_04027 [Anaerotruncus colihominis DSM 17241]|jgi:hypothetical protein|uniref:Uncharacterized protein n=1 Tax=Anaerotruncus colihominis DSM 17241 TaxID=445972 RepID=B0PH07_9FIRM|nr:hypothetical protein ANACOL_04027 [Anaerotruncus colihominis DSM 17241]
MRILLSEEYAVSLAEKNAENASNASKTKYNMPLVLSKKKPTPEITYSIF